MLKQLNQRVAQLAQQPTVATLLSVGMRVLLSLIFILAGWQKLTGYEATAQYMAAMGVPTALLPLVILTELGGGLAILLGLQTRLVALGLAGFCIISGLIFHGGADQMQQIMLMKNLAMAGGFLALVLFGGGKLSLDGEPR